MKKLFPIFFLITKIVIAQLPVGYDTLSIIENGQILYSPNCGGLNFSNFSKADINNDGKEDIIVYDRIHFFNYGEVKCFINIGNASETKYRYDYYISKSFPKLVNWAIFKDFNNDGKVDIFTSTIGGIRVYKNTSAGSNISFQLFKPIINSNYNPSGSPIFAGIYASSVGMPGIEDIDNDGDLDILAFNSTGFSVEYHINKSQEWYGHSDSLVFELVENCWGNFSEGNCAITLNNCSNRTMPSGNENKVYHSGACITCIDIDHNNVKDLLLGDVSCNNIIFGYNSGNITSAHISDTTKLFPNYPGKSSTLQIKINNFPCTYYLDADNDGIKDIIASPNLSAGENFNCVWLYKNVGINKDSFVFVKKNFLVESMLDVGEGAMPLVIDINQDGKKDLLIGNLGYYNTIKPNSNVSTLTYYQNIGTAASPQFSLITRDYLNLSSLNKLNLSPTSGDIDNDGDIDLILGDSQGKIHWLENTAGAGNPCNFSIIHQNAFGINASYPPAFPFLFDVNDDGKLDLLIGNKVNKIAYYQNVGTLSNPSFSLVTSNFGNVSAITNSIYYSGDGGAIPFMYKEAGQKYLLCGSINGNLFLYDQIDGNINGSFRLLDTMVNNIKAGIRAAPQYVDINGDEVRDLIVGNYSGGIYYFSSKAVSIELFSNNENSISIYPNPVNDVFYIQVENYFTINNAEFHLVDITGKELDIEINRHNKNFWSVNVSYIAKGVYVLICKFPHKIFTYKIIKI
jgi:hypothetical protein